MKYQVCYECDGYGIIQYPGVWFVLSCEKCQESGVIIKEGKDHNEDRKVS